jgi:hypothetical protein
MVVFHNPAQVRGQLSQHDRVHRCALWYQTMLSIVEKIQVHSALDKARPPDQFEEEIEVRFEEVDDSESCYPWSANIFLDHNVHRVTPPGHCYAFINYHMQKLSHACQETWVPYDGFIISQMSSGR